MHENQSVCARRKRRFLCTCLLTDQHAPSPWNPLCSLIRRHRDSKHRTNSFFFVWRCAGWTKKATKKALFQTLHPIPWHLVAAPFIRKGKEIGKGKLNVIFGRLWGNRSNWQISGRENLVAESMHMLQSCDLPFQYWRRCATNLASRRLIPFSGGFYCHDHGNS